MGTILGKAIFTVEEIDGERVFSIDGVRVTGLSASILAQEMYPQNEKIKVFRSNVLFDEGYITVAGRDSDAVISGFTKLVGVEKNYSSYLRIEWFEVGDQIVLEKGDRLKIKDTLQQIWWSQGTSHPKYEELLKGPRQEYLAYRRENHGKIDDENNLFIRQYTDLLSCTYARIRNEPLPPVIRYPRAKV